MRSFLACFVCVLMMGSECGWALERVQIFSLVEGLKIDVFKQREQFDAKYC